MLTVQTVLASHNDRLPTFQRMIPWQTLCSADLERQASLSDVGQGVVWLRRTIPLNRRDVLVLITLDSDLEAPEIKAIRSAEIVVEALALVVCVAEVKNGFGGPESSGSTADLDRCADALEVLLFGPERVGLNFGGVARGLAHGSDEDVEVAVVVDDDGGCGEGGGRESNATEDGGESHIDYEDA